MAINNTPHFTSENEMVPIRAQFDDVPFDQLLNVLRAAISKDEIRQPIAYVYYGVREAKETARLDNKKLIEEVEQRRVSSNILAIAEIDSDEGLRELVDKIPLCVRASLDAKPADSEVLEAQLVRLTGQGTITDDEGEAYSELRQA